MEKKESAFFARFLEDQAFPNVRSDIKAGGKPGGCRGARPVVTMNFPSDDDDPVVVS